MFCHRAKKKEARAERGSKMEKNKKKDFEIGQRMQEVRRERGKSQQITSDLLGISNKTLSKIECGETTLNCHLLSLFCELFDVSEKFIFHGTQPSTLEEISRILTGHSEKEQLLILEIAKAYLKIGKQ